MMKRVLAVLICAALFGISAIADMGVNEDSFKSWLKSTSSFDGYKLDDDSFENYDDREFSATYEKSCCAITVKVQPKHDFPKASELKESSMGSGKEVNVDGRKATYYVYKTMELVSLNILVPELEAMVSISSARKKMSLEDMEKIAKKLNIGKFANTN